MNLHLTNYQDNIGCIKSSWVFNYLPSRNIVVLLFRKKKLVSDNSLTFKICFICACPCYGIRDTIKTICPRRAKAGFLKTIPTPLFRNVSSCHCFLFFFTKIEWLVVVAFTERRNRLSQCSDSVLWSSMGARRQLTKSDFWNQQIIPKQFHPAFFFILRWKSGSNSTLEVNSLTWDHIHT